MGGSNLTVLVLMMAMSAAASAQTSVPGPTDGSRDPAAPNLINRDYLTPTGETVPHPGASQSAGVTTLDRAIQRRDDAVEKGICSNC
ncbi:conserved exported hypothetical protein [Methylocella tundrae]|uniref:Uncharacterized protein n=1 Tax=Methylocella tundrae TaxID=227605 RepID=A0A8B6M3D7_METTU|nr:hypothetical protein [Methylocella tundrae]VTZ25927.1 conserved exported hypothetical protein [Methylocella tundrae]VTZ48642.1 conserved exported hypothetical protein [Methylocella tundrae]